MTLTWIFLRLIVFAVLVVATQSSNPVLPDEKGRWGYPRTSSLEPVEHVLMGHRFRIPKAYLYLKEQWLPRISVSYCQKLVTEVSGGAFG